MWKTLQSDACRQEIRRQASLVFPVLMAQFALISFGVADTIMTGRAGPLDMPAVALAVSLWHPILLFGQGVIMAVTPAVAYLFGEGKASDTGGVIRQGIWLAVLVSIPLMAFVVFLSHHLEVFGMEKALADIAGGYLRVMVFGGPAWLLFVALRAAMEGFSRVRPAMVASLLAVFVNVPCNYLFIFGKGGFPEMGGVGAGGASAITCWTMFAVMLVFAFRMKEFRAAFLVFEAPRLRVMWSLARIGLPGALALLCEVSFFSLVALFLAPLGPVVVGGHQVALNFSSIIFIFPLSVGFAATIRVGVTLGAGNMAALRLATRVSLGISVGFALVTALLTILLRFQIAELYNPNVAIIQLAATLLFLDATYQIADGIQVAGVGILRGYNDTRAVFAVTLVCYWLVAMPLGWTLARTDVLVPALGAAGFWIAFIVGISLAAVAYLWRIRVLERGFRV